MSARSLITFFTAIVLTSSVQANNQKAGDIQIDRAFARATVPGQVSGAAYLGLENNGKTKDELVKAESSIAKSVELHTMEITANNVMSMREVKEIDLGAGKKINMKPGSGYHIMLMELTQPLKAGEKFPLTLYFKKAGKVDVMVNVEAAGQQH